MTETANRPRLLCIGLDGATLDIVEPLVEAGHLPVLQRLMARGACGRLASTQPPLSPPAWATFATGTNPGVHGVFDFVSRSEDGEFRVSNGNSVRVPTFWARLSAAGRRVGVINVPITYPPQPVDGFMISGMDAPRKSVATTYPPELGAEITARFGTYWVERHTASLLPVSARAFSRRYVAETVEMMERRGEVARWLLAKENPDVLVVVFIGTDRLQHLDGRALHAITGRRGLDAASLAQNPVATAYRAADAEIGRLLAAVDESWHVLVMSDHGFQPYERVFSLSRWLAEQGYLALDPAGMRPARSSLRSRWWARVAGRVKAAGQSSPLDRFFAAVDWQHTRAYAFGAFGSVYLNLRGREPHGTVAPADGDALLEEITEKLLRWRDPEAGVAPIVRVTRARDIYRGPLAAWGPDLILETAAGYFIRNSLEGYQPRIVEPAGQYSGRQLPHTAMHHPQGLLVLAGPAARRGVFQPGDAGIIDLAPTLLYLAGEPAPSYMEGRILTDWLDEAYVRTHAARLTEEPAATAGAFPIADADYTAEEAQIVAAHLERLGYL